MGYVLRNSLRAVGFASTLEEAKKKANRIVKRGKGGTFIWIDKTIANIHKTKKHTATGKKVPQRIVFEKED